MIPCLKRLGRWSPVLIFAASTVSLAQIGNIPLTNWTVPRYSRTVVQNGLTTMSDLTPGVAFVGVSPCRIVDTINRPTGPYGAPSLSPSVPRNFDLDSGPCTGIPSGVDAYSLNFTVAGTQGPGFLVVYPQGGTLPDVSTLNYVLGQNVANAAIVPAGTGGGITVVAGTSGTGLLIDINGYFTTDYNAGVQFVATSNVGGQGAIWGTNSSTTTGSSGVYGLASGASGATYGVFGKSSSTSTNSAGVKGVDSAGELSTVVAAARSGVRGDSASGVGVFGFSRSTAVAGSLLDGATPANVQAAGYLGYSVGMYGVYALGDIGATGMKFFVEPHPTDAGKVVRFVALEGPEAGTYFRGTGRTVGGSATIEVPESFRIVTDEDGLTVQLTAVGSASSIWVASQDLKSILVRASRDTVFHYHVYGVRRAFRSFEPIVTGPEFIPTAAGDRLPDALPEEAKRRLLANGTYNEDGSVNLTTAERLGWTRLWERRPEKGQ